MNAPTFVLFDKGYNVCYHLKKNKVKISPK